MNDFDERIYIDWKYVGYYDIRQLCIHIMYSYLTIYEEKKSI